MEGEGDVVSSVGDVCVVMCVGDCWSGGGGWWRSCLVVAVRDGDDEDGGEVSGKTEKLSGISFHIKLL
ncbi:hypothetical protein Tco_0934265 [Tanacetum coccineum]